MTNHKKYTDFVEVSSVDVDSGSLWVGDPCYVIRDDDEDRPEDLGKNWSDVSRTFFNRTGYNDVQLEWMEWDSKRRRQAMNHPKVVDFVKNMKDGDCAEDAFEKYNKLLDELVEEYTEKNPFVPKSQDTGCANFTHDMGHGGMGTMIGTFSGDGTYPVYIQYGIDDFSGARRPRRILIDMDPGADD